MNRYILIIFLLYTVIICSCGDGTKEIKPISNTDSIKISLEYFVDKNINPHNLAFSLKFTNTGERDLARCRFVINNKYEHQLEGVIIKMGSTTTKPNTSLIKPGDSYLIVFDNETDNYSIFGIKKQELTKLESIEFQCLDGKVVWKLNH